MSLLEINGNHVDVFEQCKMIYYEISIYNDCKMIC